MVKIDESLLDTVEVKTYALLFAAHALDEVGDRCGFEFLLKAMKVNELPTSVALALSTELQQTEKSILRSPAVKRYEKTFKKMLTTSAIDRLGVSSRLDALYQEPLSMRIQAKQLAAAPKSAKGGPSGRQKS